MTGRLDGKVALITGATTGIGEAIAHKIGNGALLRECTLQIPHCGLNTASFNSRYRILAMVHWPPPPPAARMHPTNSLLRPEYCKASTHAIEFLAMVHCCANAPYKFPTTPPTQPTPPTHQPTYPCPPSTSSSPPTTARCPGHHPDPVLCAQTCQDFRVTIFRPDRRRRHDSPGGVSRLCCGC